MHHSRRKSFDWYGLKQHFSIRKYHFGAASVLLGMSIALGTGTQVVQAAETVTAPESTSVASSTSATESTTSETSTETATSSSSERTVEIGYIVKYATEDGTLVNASVETVSVTTTETIAKATVSVTAVVPEGYELASDQSATVSQEVTENGVNIVTVKVVKKAEEKAATSETTTTASTETATAKSTEGAATTTATVSEAVKTPATVEEAKTVLEQVTSEAEVLANESERLVAASDKEDTALKAAAAATKLTATQATAVLKDSVATLEAVNAQINAVRTNVEALVLELRKYYPDGEITAVLDTATGTPAATTIETTNPASVSYAQHGVWEIPDPVKAANSGLTAAEREATITVAEKNYPAGYIGDQDANRDTFLIFNFDTVGGYGDGKNFNDWAGHNYYMTFSVSTDSTERAASDVVYAKLVEKTMNGDRVVKTVELKPNVKTVVDELNVLENYQAHKVKYDFTYIVSENGVTTRQISIYNSNGANWNTAVYNKLDQTRVNVNTNSFSTAVPSGTIQTTSYYVKENAATGRLRELLARYTQDSGLVGDAFHIAGAIDFDNYELIESELPKVESGILATDYKVGTQYAVFRGQWNEARLYTITDVNGALQMQVYMLDPNNPDWANFYKTKMNNSGTVSDLDDYFTLMFTTEEMQPGGTYNTKPGTFTSKFYDANKLVLEGKQVQVLDSNGDVLGTLNDAKTSYTTATGQIVNVKSVTDTMVTDEDGTVHTVNTKKIYKTDAAGNYVDADGDVLTPIQWSVDAPYKNGKKADGIADGYGTVAKFDTDSVTVSTGPLDATNTNALWKFGWNYKTPDIPDDDGSWDLGGLEMTLSNSNIKNEQNARYFYTEKGGVDVYYVDTEGNILKDMVTVVGHGDTGSEYNTAAVRDNSIVAADGTVYYYKEIDTTAKNLHPVVDDKTDTDYRSNEKIDAEKGTIKSDTVKQLTYVYEKAGNVNINYVDTEGTPLQASVADVTDGKPGSDYNTAQEGEKPEIIKTKDGKTYKLAPANTYNVGTVSDDSNLTAVGNGKAKGIDDVTGTVESGVTKEITYVYEEVKGDVIVHYVDTEGNPISGTTDAGTETTSTVEDTPESSTGTSYDTTDLRPNTITTADGKIYKRVPAATIGKEDGEVVEGTTEVTYVYELLQGDVIVHYVDTEGNTIADDVTDQVITDTGTDYDTKDNKPEKIVNDETGDVYYILPKDEVKAGDKETGKVVEGTTEVTYIYQKAGSVNVNYVDTEGNVLKDPVADVTDGKPGSDYNTAEGTEKPTTITTADGKVYALVPAGDYPVGTVAADSNLASGATPTGTVEAGVTKEVTYVYQEVKSDVVVEYYNTDGEVIAATVVDEDDKSVGTVYNTDEDNRPETITAADGTVYYYKEVKDTSAPTTGKVAETTTTVQYVYEKAGSVNVNYVDTEGTPIQAPVADETNEKAGTEYATADNKPTTITTADGKTYRLVEAGTYNVGTVSDDNNLTAVGNGKATGIDATTGTVEAGTTKEITYVYEEVKGNVVVNYITTDGTVIKQPVEDTPSTSTGTPYDTKDNKPTTITTEDGKTYRIVPVLTKGSETGKVVEGTTSITYVYEEVKGDVVVEYYDTEGNLISGLSDSGEAVDTKEVDTPSTSTGTAYNTDEDHKPNTITTADGTVYYYKEVKDTSASTTGKVVEGTTTVQYVYEKAGNVIVHYITEDGTVIKATVTDEENAKPGKSYDTTDNKPVEIVTEDGSRYVLIPSKTVGSETGTVEGGKTIEITYVYKKVANWIPQIPGVPEGQEPKVPYPFDPTNPDKPIDPTTPGTNGEVPSIPHVPGFTPVDPKTNEPLKPVDPTDPGKGYVPPTPDETGVDTPIPYVQNGNVVVNYVDENGNVLKTPVNDETDAPAGKSYDTTDNKPTEIVTEDGSRYVLIPSKTVGSETGTVEGGKTIEITYVYKKVANWIPQIPGVPEGQEPKVPYPFDPTNPDVPVTPTPDTVIPNVPGYTPVDPKTNEPLKPVDPTDPGKGYVPPTPEDSGVDTPVPYVQNGNVVVNYVTEDGTVIKTPVNDETDAPAGKSYDTTDNKPVEIVTEDGSRYVLIPSKTVGSETGTVEGGKTTEITYVYKKVANWIPQIPGVPAGEEPKVPYPFDPTTPDKPIDPTTPYPDGEVPSIPNVPGYTPVDPKTNEPLKPVDPTDPSKGYVPPTPDETGVDTPIPYVQNGNVVVNYVDENGNVLKTPVNDETDAPAGKSYDTTDNKPTEIVTEDGSRYVLIPSKTIGTENGTVEGGKTIEITYVYKKVANWIPQIPGVPEGQEPKVPYPFDPTNPDVPVTPTPDTVIPNVPGYTPVDPKTNEPLKPVDPTDPGKGYVPPTPDETGVDTPIPYVQTGNVVVNYVDENGNVLKTPVNDETNAKPDSPYDTTDNKPTEIVTEDGSRYVLIPSKTVGSETGTVEGGKTTEITYVYKKVANWVPQIPGVPEGQEPKVPYPFDPTNPDKPIDPTTPGTNGEVPSIPHVPGFTPVDPKTNEPLKPVDPNDPGKGYVPSTPDETGKDTPIPYVQNGNVVVNYVTEDGTVIKAPVQDETDAPAGKSYDTTDNKPNTITTEDGTTYELVRVEGSETGTVVGGKTTEVTYVYRKVETPAKKVVTNHVDEDGNPIAPQEEGTTPNKSIPGYEFTGKTVTDPDGNTTHIYRKVKKVVTNHVDEDGNPIAPQEEGTTPNKSIPGYEFTGKTYTDGDGNTYHVYRKVSKPVAPKPQAPVAPTTTTKTGVAQLPNTGEASSSATVLGAGMLIAALALAGKRRRNED
ncbi:MucBP domain-containing protein [Streptococcus suis]|uniref:MucBP domain-containing protein n=1 Tax=Streptococcus suis TaxID=1307 RepID=UPI001EE77908|nr:MucBP domain-containing protein [Streptococcus suis]